MSLTLITECPQCQTRFSLSPALLNYKEGQVRCGECQHIFNATQSLYDTETGEPVDWSQEQGGYHQSREFDLSFPTPEELATLPAIHIAPTVAMPAQSGIIDPLEPTMQYPTFHNEPLGTSLLTRPPAVVFSNAFTAPNLTSDSETAYQQSITASSITTPSPLWLDAVWITLIQISLLIFILSSVYFYRNALFIEYPSLRSTLQSACDSLGCKVGFPRTIQHIQVVSSEFELMPPTTQLYQLNITLKNTLGIAQQWPHMEIILLDHLDQALVRKVLSPAEYLSLQLKQQFPVLDNHSDTSAKVPNDTNTAESVERIQQQKQQKQRTTQEKQFKKQLNLTLERGIPSQQEQTFNLKLKSTLTNPMGYKVTFFYP
jgi:predicted Zn finger-like uncharacterized protein